MMLFFIWYFIKKKLRSTSSPQSAPESVWKLIAYPVESIKFKRLNLTSEWGYVCGLQCRFSMTFQVGKKDGYGMRSVKRLHSLGCAQLCKKHSVTMIIKCKRWPVSAFITLPKVIVSKSCDELFLSIGLFYNIVN